MGPHQQWGLSTVPTEPEKSTAHPGSLQGWGCTCTGPACSGGVGVPGRQAPAGVGALQVDALGGWGAVVLPAVCTLIPICRAGDAGQEKTARGGSEDERAIAESYLTPL